MSPEKKKNLPKQAGGNSCRPGFRSYADALKAHQKKNRDGGRSFSDAPTASENRVEVVKEQGVIQKLKVTCKCGEVIEIDCGYDDN